MKTKRAAIKRFKRTASGRFRRSKAGKQHRMMRGNKSPGRLRGLRKNDMVQSCDAYRLSRMLPYSA